MENLSALLGLSELGAQHPRLFALLVVVVMALEGLLLAALIDLVRRAGRFWRRRAD